MYISTTNYFNFYFRKKSQTRVLIYHGETKSNSDYFREFVYSSEDMIKQYGWQIDVLRGITWYWDRDEVYCDRVKLNLN